MAEDRQGEPITVPLQQVHMLMAGRIPLLQFCRNFAWADTEAEMVNPFIGTRDPRSAAVRVAVRVGGYQAQDFW